MIAFLPCRAGSQRAPRKNVRRFAEQAEGLLGIKLRHLLACAEIDEIILSTNDPEAIAIGQAWLGRAGGRLRIVHRPDHLCSSAASTDDVIAYVPSIIPAGDVLWTHVTSPFFDTACYSRAIAAWRAAAGHDSLVGVTELRSFVWDAKGPINYDRAREKWPRTQTLPPLYEINSAIFIAPIDVYRQQQDRIGVRPLLYAIPKAQTVEVDWEEDFLLAEELWRLRR
jgi:CMP-N-acetylneuraminic acid synthetase